MTNRPVSSIRLGYATNAFSYESVSELVQVLSGPIDRIRSRMPHAHFPELELRLGIEMVDELLADSRSFELLSETLSRRGLSVLSMNSFSPRGFHGRTVKEDAYRPTWMEQGRADYTRKVAEIFARLLPESGKGTISTSPGSFKGFGHDDAVLDHIGEAYATMAGFLHRLEDETGRRLLLCIEPEPGCSIETSDELIDFYENRLALGGRDSLSRREEISKLEAEDLVRRHIAVTFDTAHQSVEFEELPDAMRRIDEAGIIIGKVHATSALSLESPSSHPEALGRLVTLSKSPHMHQAIGVDAARRIVIREHDLDTLLSHDHTLGACSEVRIHFHLPLFLERLGPLGTTARDAQAAARFAVERGLCNTVVLETYTWAVLGLTLELADLDMEEGVAREIAWAHEHLVSARASAG